MRNIKCDNRISNNPDHHNLLFAYKQKAEVSRRLTRQVFKFLLCILISIYKSLSLKNPSCIHSCLCFASLLNWSQLLCQNENHFFNHQHNWQFYGHINQTECLQKTKTNYTHEHTQNIKCWHMWIINQQHNQQVQPSNLPPITLAGIAKANTKVCSICCQQMPANEKVSNLVNLHWYSAIVNKCTRNIITEHSTAIVSQLENWLIDWIGV